MTYVVLYGKSKFVTVNKALAVKMANRHNGKIYKSECGVVGKAPQMAPKK